MSTDTDNTGDLISGGLFAPIELLKLNDTFYTWYNTTNEIINAINPLAVYDVASGPGITVSKITGGVAVVSVNAGCGLKFDTNVSLTLDIGGTQESTTVAEEDYFIFEQYGGTNITTDSSDCETLFKVQATNILPYIVSGDHDFIGGDGSLFKTSSDNFNIDSTSVQFKTSNIYINNNPTTTDDDFENRENIAFAGFTVHAADEEPTLGYDGSILAWKSNQNFAVISDRSYVSDSLGLDASFRFSTKTPTQENISIRLLTGVRESDVDLGKVFRIEAQDTINKLTFYFENENNTIGEVPLFSSTYSEITDQITFDIEGKIYIRDIEESSQFLTVSDNTSYKVPITNTKGVLDYKFTNRFVTDNYNPTLTVGDVVKFVYADNTNTTEDIYVTGARADSEANSRVVGVVELIAGGYATIALNGICAYTGATSGQIYYLSQVSAGQVTTVKPTTGIVKEVFVGVDDSSVLVFASSTLQTPNFGSVLVDGSETVESTTYGDTLSLVAGSNISLNTNSNNEIIITAGTLANADYWSTIATDTGSPNEIAANGSAQQMFILGGNGASTESNGTDTITVNAPNSYGVIQIVGENTDELDYTLSASSGSDTLTIRSGVGINITSSTNNDLLIEAIGISIPANRSVGNQQLAEMPSYSIKGAQQNGDPVDVYQQEEVHEITYPVLAANYNVYYNTDGSRVFRDPVTLIEYPSLISEVLSSTTPVGTPDAVSGFVFGRVVDEEGNVSDLKTLNRKELRLILGASTTGFLEENNKLFNAWRIFEEADLYNPVASETAESKSGTLNLIGGLGIDLELDYTGDGNPAIKIIATGDAAAFSEISNNTTAETLTASGVGSTLNITERDAVGIDITSNNELDFYIKSNSITNDMLAGMPENSVKVNTGGTNDTSPVDLYIDENQILGRLEDGFVKALSASEVRQIIGLTSSDYYKQVTCYTGATLVGTSSASSSENLTLRGGTNVSLTILGDNSIRIDATTDAEMYGIKTVAFSESGTTYSPTHLIMDEVYLSSSSGLYNNIDIIPSYSSSSSTLSVSLDLGVMPQRSVKVAGSSFNSVRGGYLASNLILGQGQVLGVTPSGTSVSGITFADVVNNSGLNYYSSFSLDGYVVSASGSDRLRFVSDGDTSLSYDGSAITISSNSTLSSDATPTLGGNLELNSNFILQNTRKSINVVNSLTYGTNHYLNIENVAGRVELKAVRDTSSASSIDMVLTPYGTGSVVSKMFSSDSSNNLTLKTGTSDGRIYVDGNASTFTILSATSNKNLYLSPGSTATDINLFFYNGVTERTIRARRISNDTALIHANTSGNLILCAGYIGSGIGVGSNSVQMNSNILMASSKTITSEDNIVKLYTTDDGYLKISGSNKSVSQKIFSGSFVPATSRQIDSYSLAAIGNCVKYLVRGENPSVPKDTFLLEFNVIVSGTETVVDVVSLIYAATAPTNTQNVTPVAVSNGSKVDVLLNTISTNHTISVFRTAIL
jgi:hypothetical protein